MEDKKTEENVQVRELNQDQLKKLRDGLDVKAVTTMPGWKIISDALRSRAYHSWVDPRGMSKEEWEWAELNAFHSHDVAEQILLDIQEMIEEADQLENYRLGKDDPTRMKI